MPRSAPSGGRTRGRRTPTAAHRRGPRDGTAKHGTGQIRSQPASQRDPLRAPQSSATEHRTLNFAGFQNFSHARSGAWERGAPPLPKRLFTEKMLLGEIASQLPRFVPINEVKIGSYLHRASPRNAI